jgi:hypothetical protein
VSSTISSARARREVAARAAQERDHARAVGIGRRDLRQVALEVADDAVDVERRVLVGERGGAVAHGLLGDVERHVAPERAGALHRVEQHARLGRRARPELDQLGHARAAHDRVGVVPQDRALGPGRVVLREVADAVEQLRAAGVVEVLGRQLLERTGQAVEDVVGQRRGLGGDQ